MNKNYQSGFVFTAACIGMLLFGIVFLSLGTINTFLQEKFGLDAIHAGSLASTLPFGILLGSLVFGPIADRFGYKLLIIISSVLIIVALEAIAFAKSLILLEASFFLIGFGGGIINGGTNALAADVTDQAKGARLSLLGIFFGIGALGMPLLMGFLSEIWSYNTIISVIGAFVLLPVTFFILIKFPEPKQKQGFPLRRAYQLIKSPLIFFIGLILFFESGLEGIVSNWTTSYLKSCGFTTENALFALSAQVMALITGRLALSRLLKMYSPLISFFICIALIIAGSVWLFDTTAYWHIIAAMVLIGLGFAAGFPVMLGLTGEKFPDISGTAFSMVMVMALTGNMLMNYLTGILAKAPGINHFPWLLTGSVLLMAALLFNIRKEFK